MKDKLADYAGGDTLGCPACGLYYDRWLQRRKARGPLEVMSYEWECPECNARWAERIDDDGNIIALRGGRSGQDV